MKRIRDKDEFELSTGRTFYANCGILGLRDDSDDICEGYDGIVSEFDDNPFTEVERKEIAEYMISLWRKWGERGPRAL